jgi:hypothetical protein
MIPSDDSAAERVAHDMEQRYIRLLEMRVADLEAKLFASKPSAIEKLENRKVRDEIYSPFSVSLCGFSLYFSFLLARPVPISPIFSSISTTIEKLILVIQLADPIQV